MQYLCKFLLLFIGVASRRTPSQLSADTAGRTGAVEGDNHTYLEQGNFEYMPLPG